MLSATSLWVWHWALIPHPELCLHLRTLLSQPYRLGPQGSDSWNCRGFLARRCCQPPSLRECDASLLLQLGPQVLSSIMHVLMYGHDIGQFIQTCCCKGAHVGTQRHETCAGKMTGHPRPLF